jgi:hypothetical protein
MNKVLIQDGLVHEIFGEVAPELHEGLLVVDAPVDVECGYSYADGVFAAPEPQPEPTYAELRAEAYPSIQDQLDMLYWDKANGTNLWQQAIAEIKQNYPKPQQESNDD